MSLGQKKSLERGVVKNYFCKDLGRCLHITSKMSGFTKWYDVEEYKEYRKVKRIIYSKTETIYHRRIYIIRLSDKKNSVCVDDSTDWVRLTW